MLMRMYSRWAERNKYPVEVFDTSYAEEAGLKSATFAIHAPYAYGTLSVEAGTPPPGADWPLCNQGRRPPSLGPRAVGGVPRQTGEVENSQEGRRPDAC